jgi:YD repeat-containing protein
MIKWILSSSVLIGAVIGLRYLFRGKISARLQYALWALVLVRLLMPSGIFSMPFSVDSLVGTIQSQPVVQDVITDLHEPGLTYDEAYEQAKNELMPNEPHPGQTSKPNGETAARINHRASTLMQLATPSLIIETVLTGAWYLGIAVVAIVFLVSNIKFSITLRRKRQLLRKKKVRIYTCEGLNTPCLFGLFRPAIYLAPEDAEDAQRLEHIIAHELTHRKHWDHIWSFLRCACLAIHWYNPLVWIAAIASRQDGELACDEATIKKLGEEQRIPYGETLVQTTCAAKPTTGILGIATTMTGSKEAIKQRILRIAHKFKFNVYAFISVLLIGAISIGCTWFGAIPSDDEIVTVYLLDQAVTTRYASGKTERIVCKYDNNYNLISASGKSHYEYDENNRILSKSEGSGTVYYHYNDQGQIIQCTGGAGKYNYTYDSQGRVIHCEGKRSGETFTSEYSYDSSGVLRTSKTTYSNGHSYQYAYNADGNLIKFEFYRNGKLHDTREYTYDIFGRVTSYAFVTTHIYPTTAKAYENAVFTYDLAGRLVKAVYESDYSAVKDPMILSDADGTIYYRYDLFGNLLEIREDHGKGSRPYQTFTYDLYGKVIRHQVKNLWDYRYAYDGNGNIISESNYSDTGELYSITNYTYIAVQVTRKDAERLLAQQDTIIDFLFEHYPTDPMPEKEQFYP